MKPRIIGDRLDLTKADIDKPPTMTELIDMSGIERDRGRAAMHIAHFLPRFGKTFQDGDEIHAYVDGPARGWLVVRNGVVIVIAPESKALRKNS